MPATLETDAAGDWLKWLNNFDAAFKAFVDNRNAMLALRPWVAQNQPKLLPQHDALLKRYADQWGNVQMLAGMRETVAQWIASIPAMANAVKNAITLQFPVVGASMTMVQAGIDAIKKQFGLSEYDDNRLGFAPIVVAVGIAGATAIVLTIAALVKDTWEYSQRLNALQSLQAKGMTPDQAAATVNQILGGPADPNNWMGIPVGTIALAAVAIVLGPPIVAMIGGRRK